MFQRPSEPDINTDYLIIGAGVAGINLAIKLSSIGKEVWLLGSPYESQLAKAGVLQNTNLPEGTVGLKYIEEQIKLAKEKGVKHKSSLVEKISIGDSFLVETRRQKFYPKYIIIASGAKQKRMNFPGEVDFFHKGISDCSICDFPLYGDRIVGVLGNHEYTSRAANFLIDKTRGVHLFWYKNNDKPELDDRIELYHIDSIEAIGGDTISSVRVNTSDGIREVELEGLFVEGKPYPSSEFLEGVVELDDAYVVIDDDFRTSISNIYALGDVTGKTSNYTEVMDAVDRLFLKLITKK